MAIKTWNVGDVLTAADMNEWGGGSTGYKYATKAASTTRSSTTTLTADPDLTLTVDANKMYEMAVWLQFTSVTAAGFKCDITVPASTVFSGYNFVQSNSGGTGFTDVTLVPGNVTLAGNLGFHYTSTTAFDYFAKFDGILNTAGTAGSVTVRWAQDVSTAGNTTLYLGSSIRLKRIS